MQRTGNKVVRNREYDPFAPLYNRHWGVQYRTEVLPLVERLLLARLAEGAAVLDICCGTGQFAATVRERGYNVEGFDASGEMIRFARRNARGVRFTVADVRAFHLNRRFDAAYCLYESLNHVPDIAGLGMAFRCVRSHLKRGAPFLFDLNREEAYQLYWNNTDAMVAAEEAYITRSRFDETTRIATCDITTFAEGASGWQRDDFTLRQSCHAIGEAQAVLQEAGFRDVALFDARDMGMSDDTGYGRTFFLASA